MAEKKATLRFDHREIAVIFSLFVFVSLLMFSVGVLVGKGLTLSKFEGKVPVDVSYFESEEEESDEEEESYVEGAHGVGTSVSTDDPPRSSHKMSATNADRAPRAELKKDPFKPVPADDAGSNLAGDKLAEPNFDGQDLKTVLNNPEIKALLEEEIPGRRKAGGRTFLKSKKVAKKPKRKPAAARPKFPTSFSDGKFTVQVASYPTKDAAEQRVRELKRMGFIHAYLSAKELPSKNMIWYRVWLGFYPDFKSAKRNAEHLQSNGEVKNYLVRKSTDAKG